MAAPPVTDSLAAQTRVLRGRMSEALPRSGQNHMPVRLSVSPCGMASGVKVTSAAETAPQTDAHIRAAVRTDRRIMGASFCVGFLWRRATPSIQVVTALPFHYGYPGSNPGLGHFSRRKRRPKRIRDESLANLRRRHNDRIGADHTTFLLTNQFAIGKNPCRRVLDWRPEWCARTSTNAKSPTFVGLFALPETGFEPALLVNATRPST